MESKRVKKLSSKVVQSESTKIKKGIKKANQQVDSSQTPTGEFFKDEKGLIMSGQQVVLRNHEPKEWQKRKPKMFMMTAVVSIIRYPFFNFAVACFGAWFSAASTLGN
jgi:hypothetical protein